MSMTFVVLLVILVAVMAALIFAVADYNQLVSLRNRFRNAYAQIDVQLKRRYDLIPNLVETAKGYLKHERGTLEEVIAARNTASAANSRAAANPGEAGAMKEISSAESALAGSLGRLMAVAEAYPDLSQYADGQPDGGIDLDGKPGVVCAPGLQRRGHAL